MHVLKFDGCTFVHNCTHGACEEHDIVTVYALGGRWGAVSGERNQVARIEANVSISGPGVKTNFAMSHNQKYKNVKYKLKLHVLYSIGKIILL